MITFILRNFVRRRLVCNMNKIISINNWVENRPSGCFIKPQLIIITGAWLSQSLNSILCNRLQRLREYLLTAWHSDLHIFKSLVHLPLKFNALIFVHCIKLVVHCHHVILFLNITGWKVLLWLYFKLARSFMLTEGRTHPYLVAWRMLPISGASTSYRSCTLWGTLAV